MAAHTITPPPLDDVPWQYVPASASVPAHYVYPKPIQKSERDDRFYKLIKLENGMQAMLVHDPSTDKAAASLDVGVGHLSDPVDMPGLAHFCEHLLFMGTEQFPKENEYSEYLSKNGGSSNAYTATSNTNYYFNVGIHAFEGAVERFSGFFHSPLFSPSCTMRELNAVESENKKNLQSDMWRIFQLNKHLSKPGHVWSKFGSGNKETLMSAGKALKSTGALGDAASTVLPSPIPSRVGSPTPSNLSSSSESDADGGAVGRETRRRLVEWWNEEYCASRMGLTLIGRENLDQLTEFAAKYFSPIPNRGQSTLPYFPDHPFGPAEMGSIVDVKTVMDFQAFELSFPLPYQPPKWRTKSAHIIAHFVGHEGPGSLHSYLKSKGWSTSLSASVQSLARGFAMFKITVHLTKEGFQRHREALLLCFKYLALLRSSEYPAWFFREIQLMNDTGFRFAEKRSPDTYATWISEQLSQPRPREVLLSGPLRYWDWDEADVRATLDTLTIDRGRVVVMSKEHGPGAEWKHEPWYQTEYRVQGIDEEFAAAARASNDIQELYLPGPNEFVPSNLEVEMRSISQPLKRPILVRQTPLSSLWHKKDDQFGLPKAQVIIEIRSSLANSSPRASVMTRLYTELVNDALTEYSYDAGLAGLSYDFDSHPRGTYVGSGGYNDKLHVLVRNVLEKARHLSVNPDRLEVMKEKVKQEWENFSLGQSYLLSDYYGKYLLTDRLWTLTEKLGVISGVSAQDLALHIGGLLNRVDIHILVNGNLRKDEAIKIAESTEKILGGDPFSADEKIFDRSLILPEACNYVFEMDVPNKNETNSGLTYYCHVGDIMNPRLRVTFALLAQIVSEPAFNVLRTQEQLGYIVSASPWHKPGSLGLRVLVQSEKDPRYLEMRVEAFLASMRATIEEMPDALFEEQRMGLIQKWTETLKNLSEETNRFWTHIDSGYFDFFRRERDSVLLQTVTREEVMAMYSQFLDPTSPSRSKLSVHLRPQKIAPPKFSVAASQAFLVQLRAQNIVIDEEQYQQLSAAEPPVAAVKAHWIGVLLQSNALGDIDPAVGQRLVDAIEVLAKTHPTISEGDVALRDGAVLIQDIEVFKAGLTVSEFPKPVEVFHDLPVSKF